MLIGIDLLCIAETYLYILYITFASYRRQSTINQYICVCNISTIYSQFEIHQSSLYILFNQQMCGIPCVYGICASVEQTICGLECSIYSYVVCQPLVSFRASPTWTMNEQQNHLNIFWMVNGDETGRCLFYPRADSAYMIYMVVQSFVETQMTNICVCNECIKRLTMMYVQARFFLSEYGFCMKTVWIIQIIFAYSTVWWFAICDDEDSDGYDENVNKTSMH